MLRLFIYTIPSQNYSTSLNSMYLFYSFDTSENPDGYSILSLSSSQEINKNGTLDFSCLRSHPRSGEITPYKTYFLLAEEEECIFFGFVNNVKEDFTHKLEISCDGYLRALYYPSYSGVNGTTYTRTISGFMSDIIIRFKSSSFIFFCSSKVSVGEITLRYFDPDTTYDYESNDIRNKTIGDFLFNDLLKDLQSLIRIRINGSFYTYHFGDDYDHWYKGYRINNIYIDFSDTIEGFNSVFSDSIIISGFNYLLDEEKYSITSNSFKFGVNLFNLEKEYPISDIYTGVYFTYKVNDSEYTIPSPKYNAESKEKFGTLTTIVNTSDKYSSSTTAETEAQKYADTFLGIRKDKLTIHGLDPYFFNDNRALLSAFVSPEDGDIIQPEEDDPENPRDPYPIIKIADSVGCYSEPHNINTVMCCLSFDVDYFNPTNSTYVIGEYIPDSNISGDLTSAQQLQLGLRHVF